MATSGPSVGAMKPYALCAGAGWIFDYGIPHVVKCGELHPGRGAAVIEFTTRIGEEPADHTHRTEDEIFYVLEGEITFHCDGKEFELSAGGFAFLPCGLKHGYKIAGEREVRLLVITFPVSDGSAGWGGYVADVERDGEATG